MHPKRYFGVLLIVVAVAAAWGLDRIGRDQVPRSYTVEFTRGTNLPPGGQRLVKQIAAAMAARPAYSAVVVGHTGTRGDPAANQALGRQRAEAVGKALRSDGIAGDRIELHSAGGSDPLKRRDDEGDRGYQSRLSRAEVRLSP